MIVVCTLRYGPILCLIVEKRVWYELDCVCSFVIVSIFLAA